MHSGQVDMHSVNILLELHMGQGQFAEAVKIVENLNVTLTSLPLDLAVNYGICCAYLGDDATAESCFARLRSVAPEEFPDLFFHVGETLLGTGRFHAAQEFLEPLSRVTDNDVTVWRALGHCQRALGNPTAVETFRRAVAMQPSDVESVVALSTLLRSLHRPAEALEAVDSYVATLPLLPSGDPPPIDLRVAVEKGLLHGDLGDEENFLHMCFPIVRDSALFPGRQNRRKRKKKTKTIEIVQDEGVNILHFQTPTTTEIVSDSPPELQTSLYEILGEDELYNLIVRVRFSLFLTQSVAMSCLSWEDTTTQRK